MPKNFLVLIVEDDDDARRNVEDILSLDGYKITSASHCLPAIDAIESQQFDAAIVDWTLPDGDGGQLISLIVEHQPNTPVVVVTGMREFDTAVTALRQGAYDFLPKPINPDILRSVLRRLVERKKHLREIEIAQEKLVDNERLAAIGQMVAGLAHESRNAFQRSHACLAELSLDLENMPDSLKLVRKVQKALDDVHLLLEEVRQYSAPIILEKRVVAPIQLIKETWQQILDARPADQPPHLKIEVSGEFPESCAVDRIRMGQVFRNLLENAFFACHSTDTISVRATFEAEPEPMLRFDFIDSGDGVEDEYRETIFAPFFTTKTKGTGLGLAISKRIVEAHGGHIWVEDAQSGGAQFIVELPFCTK